MEWGRDWIGLSCALLLATFFVLGTVGESVVAAQSPVLVSDSAVFEASSRLVFRNPRGLQRYYQFFFYSPDLTWFYKYSSDGISWSAFQAGIDGIRAWASVWVHDDGSKLIVHFVAQGLGWSIIYRRGTIADTSEAITWGAGQIVDAGGSNARNFGVSITRTANGRPVITAVKESFVSPNYQYEVRAWGATSDVDTPFWVPATLMVSIASVGQQNTGYTSPYPAGGNYVFVAASAARVVDPTFPWDVSWVRASWDGVTWSVGTVKVLDSAQSAVRPPSLVLDENLLPHALVLYSSGFPIQLLHYKGMTQDGSIVQSFTVSSQAVTSVTLSIDTSVFPRVLKAIYHYGSVNLYWKETKTDTISWGAENTILWAQDATHLGSSQTDFLGVVHVSAESSSGVYYASP